MKDKESLHKKTQEFIDCFATTDPLKEMSELGKGGNEEEEALKWLALTALHGINMNAKKISIKKSKEGEFSVTVKYREKALPSPGPNIGQKIIDLVRGITHLEEDKGKTTLALGVRDGSIDLNVKVKKEKDEEEVSLKFPD
jgi:hypothetical protein